MERKRKKSMGDIRGNGRGWVAAGRPTTGGTTGRSGAALRPAEEPQHSVYGNQQGGDSVRERLPVAYVRH